MTNAALWRMCGQAVTARLIVASLCAFAPQAVLAEDGVTADTVLIGQSAAFSGPSAGLGVELWRGAQAYFSQLNASGGVHGRKVIVATLDDKYDPALSLPHTIDFLVKQKVFALFGYVGTPTLVKALPALQKFADQNVFLFSNFTGAQPQRQPPFSRFVFNIRPSYRQETEKLVDNFVRVGRRRVGVFFQNDAYGRSGLTGSNMALAKHKLAVVAEATYPRGASAQDSMAQQVEIMRRSGVDAIISIGAYAAAAAFVRDLRAAGLSVPVANVSFVGPDAFLEFLQRLSKDAGTDLTRQLIVSQVVPPWSDVSVPLVREYRDAMRNGPPGLPPLAVSGEYKPSDLSFGGLEGFLNAKMFTEILRRSTAALTRKGFLAAAESIQDLDVGLAETVSFSADDHDGLSTVYCTTIKDGAYTYLTNWGDFK